jgi:acetyl-CoA/propionyl-CoA carboxylase biotin carboxyl carrier protein
MKYRVERKGIQHEVDVDLTSAGYVVRGADGEAQLIRIEQRSDGSRRAITPWGELELTRARRGNELWADVGGRRLSATVERLRSAGAAGAAGASAGTVRAPMPGKLLAMRVKVGDSVKAGQPLAVIEAMKMENEIVAPIDGVVTAIAATAPATVEKAALLLELQPS